MIGAVFEGGSQLGLEFETVEIDSRSYIENDVTFTVDTEGAQSGTIWRTDEPITKEARNNMVQKNMTVRYTSRRSNAKWFILKFEVEQGKNTLNENSLYGHENQTLFCETDIFSKIQYTSNVWSFSTMF